MTTKPIRIMSINIEGLTSTKELILSSIIKNSNIDILAMQETHRSNGSRKPRIEGMKLVADRPHEKYGSAILVKENMAVLNVWKNDEDDIEILTADTGKCIVSSVYKPPNEKFEWKSHPSTDKSQARIVIGDFNSHSVNWGYAENDADGELVEKWADEQRLHLIYDAKLPASFNSGRWKRGYNPDNIFVSERIAHLCYKQVADPIPHTQHRPIICEIRAAINPILNSNPPPRFNFKKANWKKFKQRLDMEVAEIIPVPENYELFNAAVKKVSKECIPRGARKKYNPGMKPHLQTRYMEYVDKFNSDPFDEDTIKMGHELALEVAESRQKDWQEVVENLDFSKDSRKAWGLLKKINGEKAQQSNFAPVTANQVAHQLLLNGKTERRKNRKSTKLERTYTAEEENFATPITNREITAAIKVAKKRKAAGVDKMYVEQIKNFGPVTIKWIQEMYNVCVNTLKIPKMWRQAHVIALQKPGKALDDPKSYRPISLLCHLYEIFERVILNRMKDKIDSHLIRQQAGFRPGKSCTRQVLNLTQHIEDGFETRKVTGVVFVDLTAAFDTVCHRTLRNKVYELTKDFKFTEVIGMLLKDRRFYVTLNGKDSSWRQQKNGLPQGSELSPTLFNIYTNDQPIGPDTRHFLYADDLALAAQHETFVAVEDTLNQEIERLDEYYRSNHLKPNPSKTETCSFHLRSREAKR